jgi:lipopolysaccharide/colanic/teichoic acid biosynthesis glycosyltransferase
VLPVIGDIAIMLGALMLSLWIRQPKLLHVRTLAIFMPLFVLWVTTIYTAGLYELRLIRDFVTLVGGLLASAVVCWILGTMYFYLPTPYMTLAPKTHLLVIVALTHVIMFAWRRALLTILGFSLLDLRILVLADENHRNYLRTSTQGRFSGGLNLANGIHKDLDLVVVDRAWAAGDPVEVRHQMATAVASRIPVVSLDEFYESLFGKVSPSAVSDLAWAIDHVLSRSGSLYFKTKRLVDLIAASLLLVAAMPVLIVTAALIRLTDGIPAFYGQERAGYLRRPFILWKFRTMRPGADRHGPFARHAGDADPRVTRLGGFLRRFRIDELPQLWNIIRGEMSLVGPRPEWIREVEILEKAVPNYHLRHLAQPGMTGWAQVYFRATNDPHDSIEKHQYDLYYLKHFSLALDFSIMLKTVKRVLVKDSRVISARAPFPFGPNPQIPTEVDIASIVGAKPG